MACCQSRLQALLSSGGESAPGGDGLASDAQGGNEAHPVWVVSAVVGSIGHQGADRVVAAQVAPDLLLDQVGGLRPEYQSGPRWWVLRASKVSSISHRCR